MLQQEPGAGTIDPITIETAQRVHRGTHANLMMDAIESTTRAQRARVFLFGRAGLSWLVVAATCGVLLACASKPPAAQNRCPPNRPGCQVEVVFNDVGLGERVVRLEGRLSAEQPSAIYLFTAAAGETLRLHMTAPVVRLVLTRPNGQTEGPGLPAEMVLPAKGKYTLRIAANSMAESSYGDFVLELRLIRAP